MALVLGSAVGFRLSSLLRLDETKAHFDLVLNFGVRSLTLILGWFDLYRTGLNLVRVSLGKRWIAVGV